MIALWRACAAALEAQGEDPEGNAPKTQAALAHFRELATPQSILEVLDQHAHFRMAVEEIIDAGYTNAMHITDELFYLLYDDESDAGPEDAENDGSGPKI